MMRHVQKEAGPILRLWFLYGHFLVGAMFLLFLILAVVFVSKQNIARTGIFLDGVGAIILFIWLANVRERTLTAAGLEAVFESFRQDLKKMGVLVPDMERTKPQDVHDDENKLRENSMGLLSTFFLVLGFSLQFLATFDVSGLKDLLLNR